jgi:hypothetical protein
MELDQLMDRYLALQKELSVAYEMRPWPSRRIDGIAEDLMATERQIVSTQSIDEQCGDLGPSFAHMGAINRLSKPPAYARG